MPIAHIRVMLFRVSALKVLRAAHRQLERRQAVLPPATPFSSDNSPMPTLSRLTKGNRASPITHASSGQQFEVADRDKALILVLHVPVVEVKFQLIGVPEIVLYHHDKVLQFGTLRGVVQTDFLVFEQVVVVGQEGDPVIHFQRALPLKLEIPDGIKRIGKVACLFHITAYFHRFLGYGHGFHRKGIGLLEVHIIVARHESKRKYG